MKKSRFTDSQIIAVLKQAQAGTPAPELWGEHGISSATLYKWRSKCGGMEASMVGRMKDLEEENRRLKKMCADAQLSADLLKEALSKRVRPSQRREMSPGIGDDVIAKRIADLQAANPGMSYKDASARAVAAYQAAGTDAEASTIGADSCR